MAIKDKDGNVYKLKGPNPLMKNQNWRWDASRIIMHNVQHEEEIVEDERNPIQKFKTDYNIVDIGEHLGLMPERDEPEPEPVQKLEPEPEPVELKDNTVQIYADERLAGIMQREKIEFLCAPVIEAKQIIDPLRGSHTEYRYGHRDVFEGFIVAESDFEIQFWCVRPVTINSVVYPRTRTKRWWRVDEVESKSGGYLCIAFMSESNPNFD